MATVTRGVKSDLCLSWCSYSKNPVVFRFTDEVDMDVVAVFVVDPASGLYPYYNCSATSSSCALPLFDPAHGASEVSKAAVSWGYGTQQFT